MRWSAISLFLVACNACQHPPAETAEAPLPPTDSTAQPAPAPLATAPNAAQPSSSVAVAAADATTPVASLPLLFVGSGDWGTATGAVSAYRFAASSGALTLQHRTEAGGLLSFLASDTKRRFLYAADEEQKLLRSFSIDPSSGALTPLATRATESGPVFVRVTQADSHILAAQFSGGKTEVFPLDAAGGFGERASAVASGAESHSVYLSPDERFAFVPGRGSDRITQFTFSSTTGKLAANGFTAEPKGAGCRHMAFDAAGTHAYLVNEFHNTISVFDYTASSGKLKKIQSVSTLPKTFAGKSSAADIHLHPNGHFLYATNRPAEENGSVVAYRIEANGTLSLIEHESTLGRVPRNFTLSADGSRLIVGNQESKSITIFSVDSETGGLTKLSEVALDVKPFFVSFL